MGEIWHFIGPLLQKVFVTGQPGMLEDSWYLFIAMEKSKIFIEPFAIVPH